MHVKYFSEMADYFFLNTPLKVYEKRKIIKHNDNYGRITQIAQKRLSSSKTLFY